MKIRKRTIIITVIVLIIALIGYSIVASSSAPKKVTTDTIKKGDLSVVVSASGKVESLNSTDLRFTETGRISYLSVKEGDAVKAGQVIAYLDGSTVKQQENKAWADYRLQLEKIREFEENNRDKPKDTDYQIEKAQLEATRDSYAALVGQTLTGYKDKTLISPIDGTVAKVNAKLGETAPATEPVVTIVNQSLLEFVAEVDEQDIGTLTTGLTADVFLDAFNGQTFQGTISKIESIAKIGTTGNTYYPVHLTLNSTNVSLLVGMNGDADIKTNEKPEVVLVPLDVIIDDEDKKVVYLVENNTLKKQEIKTGLQNDLEAEVISGLQEGNVIVTGDTSALVEGQIVQIENK